MNNKHLIISVGEKELEIIDKYNRMSKKEKEEYIKKNGHDSYLMTLVEISPLYA